MAAHSVEKRSWLLQTMNMENIIMKIQVRESRETEKE